VQDVLLGTLSSSFRLAAATDQTNTSWATIVPTITEPGGAGSGATAAAVFSLTSKDGNYAQNGVKVVPFGTTSNNNTFSLRVYAWSFVRNLLVNNASVDLWVPVNLLEVVCTLTSAMPGVTGSAISASHYFCQTITVTTGSTLSGEAAAENVVSPANGTIAHFVVDLKGFQKLQLDFSVNGGSATAMNALLSLL
jgi:hypothetical protein